MLQILFSATVLELTAFLILIGFCPGIANNALRGYDVSKSQERGETKYFRRAKFLSLSYWILVSKKWTRFSSMDEFSVNSYEFTVNLVRTNAGS